MLPFRHVKVRRLSNIQYTPPDHCCLSQIDWTEINIVERITKVVARVSSCMFGGTELSENEKWVEASIAFAIDGFHGAQKIKRFPHVLRPIAKYFISEIRSIAGHYAEAEKAAIPIIEARQKAGEKALDLLYWMSDQAKGSERNMKFIASILLKVSLTVSHYRSLQWWHSNWYSFTLMLAVSHADNSVTFRSHSLRSTPALRLPPS